MRFLLAQKGCIALIPLWISLFFQFAWFVLAQGTRDWRHIVQFGELSQAAVVWGHR